jgi:hypothetical protein
MANPRKYPALAAIAEVCAAVLRDIRRTQSTVCHWHNQVFLLIRRPTFRICHAPPGI